MAKEAILFNESKKDETAEQLNLYFKDLLDRAKNFKEGKPYVERELKSGKLDREETTGVLPAFVTKKIKEVELVKPSSFAKKAVLPKQQQQPSYKTPEEKIAEKKFEKGKKSFNKKVAKALTNYIVKKKEDLD